MGVSGNVADGYNNLGAERLSKGWDLYSNYEYPEGMKVIDEWIDLTGYRMFVIYETEGEKIYAPSISPFIGLCRFETIPVMKADKYMQMAQETC